MSGAIHALYASVEWKGTILRFTIIIIILVIKYL
jgi:hypothetical protein